MSRDLDTLHAWATDKARTDEDPAARPLWGRIRDEIEAFNAGELVVTEQPPDTPSLFDQEAS